jgi:hypothetical protein
MEDNAVPNPIARLRHRTADTLKFRVGQQIRLRDAEIELLRDKLDLFRNAYSLPPSTRTSARYLDLKQQLIDAQSRFELRRRRMAADHDLTLQSLKASHHRALERLQSAPRGASRDDVDTFLESYGRAAPRAVVRDPIQKGTADHELQKIQAESCEVEHRIRDLEGLIRKVKSRELPSIETSDPAEHEQIDGEIRERQRREIERIEGQIDRERQRTRSLREEIARAKGDGESGDREDWTVTALRMVASGSDEEKRRCARVLLEENRALKEEIARIDFMLYGRSGKYQKLRAKR